MVGLEWTTCAQDEPVRGSVVSPYGVAWSYDSGHVLVIPIESGRIKLHSMRPVARTQVKVIGKLSKRCLDTVRERMTALASVNSSAYSWDHTEVASSDDMPLPWLSEGYYPIGYSDGCYWRLLKH